MDCKDVKENLGTLIDGEVSDAEREALLSHIAECETCQREYEELLSIKKEFSRLDLQLKGALADSVMQKICAEVYPEKKKPFFLRHLGTAAALLIIAGLFVYTRVNPISAPKEEGLRADAPTESVNGESEYDYAFLDKADTDDAEDAYVEDGNTIHYTNQETITTYPSVSYPMDTPAESEPEEAVPEEPMAPDEKPEAESPIGEPEMPKAESPMEEPESPMEEPESPMEEPAAEPEMPKSESPMEEPPKKYPVVENYTDEVTLLSDYRFQNSIATDTAIIFVDSTMETVLPLFANASSIGSNQINVDEHHSKVMDILLSNSITVTASDIPEGTTETAICIE